LGGNQAAPLTNRTLSDSSSYGLGPTERALLFRGSATVNLTASARLLGFSDGSFIAAEAAVAVGEDSFGETPTGARLFPTNPTPVNGIVELTAASRFQGPTGGFTGRDGFALLSGNGLAIPSPVTSPGGGARGQVDVYLGDNAVSPFSGRHLQLYSSTVSSSFGNVAIGNAYSGRAGSYSLPFVGTAAGPNLVLGGAVGSPRLSVIGAAKLNSLSTSGLVDVGILANADILLEFDPTKDQGRWPFTSGEPDFGGAVTFTGVPVHDLNGDGYADIAFATSDSNPNLTPVDHTHDGRVIVLY
jgi:hypothetical protein